MKGPLSRLAAACLIVCLLSGCAGAPQGSAPSPALDASPSLDAAPSPEVSPSPEATPSDAPASDTVTVPAFETRDLDGNTVTNDIFAQKDLTVVNVWGTFCTPCIDEMPALGEWMREMPENVQLIGIVIDLPLEGEASIHDAAVEILEGADAPFTCLETDGSLQQFLSGILGVPTTFLVDSDGSVVGNVILGADLDGYKQAVEDYFDAQG